MLLKPFATALIMTIFSCSGIQSQENQQSPGVAQLHAAPAVYTRIAEIPPPPGFERTYLDEGSFGGWLRTIGLKEDKTVYLFNGSAKENQSAQFAVLDISVGERDLQQCADAAMRLRAEFLYSRKEFDKIQFTDNEAGIYQFVPPYTRQHFTRYLNRVFGMCGTASLDKQMRRINASRIQPGDLLLKAGFPGHAVIIVDVVENAQGKKRYLLAQSYMPAQDIHVLVNPNDEKSSPWYEIEHDQVIETPEWTFNSSNQLKTW